MLFRVYSCIHVALYFIGADAALIAPGAIAPERDPETKRFLACQQIPHLHNQKYANKKNCFIEDQPGVVSRLASRAAKSLKRFFGFASKEATVEPSAIVVDFYFVRHAESKWNEYKNGKKGAGKQGITESKYQDAELSEAGVKQVIELRDNITQAASDNTRPLHSLPIFGKIGNDVAFATSNLRRAALTLLIAFEKQILDKNITEVYSLSDLQEISSGYDAKTLTDENVPPYLSFKGTEEEEGNEKYTCPFEKLRVEEVFNAECNMGDQKTGGTERIKRFCNWMNHLHLEKQKNKFVIVGHSAWLQDFFVHYLGGETSPINFRPTKAGWPIRYQRIVNPSGINEDEKKLLDVSGKKKLSNAGVLYAKIKLTGNNCEIMVSQTEILSGEVKKSGT